MKNYLLTVGLLFTVLKLWAQQEIVNVSYTHNTLKNDSLSGEDQHFEASAVFPVYKNEQHLIGGKLIYTNDLFSGLHPLLQQRLQGIDLNLLWQMQVNATDKFQLGALVGAFSNFKTGSDDVLRYRIVGNYSRRYSDQLTAGLGLVYNHHFNAHMWVPFTSVDWKLGKLWKISGMLPIKPKINYLINDKWNWVSEGIGHAETYKVQKNVIELTGWTLMSSLQYTLQKHHRIQAGLGWTLSQRLRYYHEPQAMKLKLYNFDLQAKEDPMVDITTKGWRWNVGYTFLF